MDWQSTPYLAILGMAGFLTATLAVFGFQRRTLPGADAFYWLMLGMFQWTGGYFLELASAGLAEKLFWARTQYLGASVLPLVWLALALQFSRRQRRLDRRALLILGVIPAITLALVWTNEWHSLVWSDVRLVASEPLARLHFTYSTWFWIYYVYSSLIVLLGITLLVQSLLHSPSLYRRQVIILLAGIFIPLVGSLLYVLGLSPLPHLDLTPFLFVFTGLVFAWGLFRFRIFDVVPMARETVIESMREGVIVVDGQDRIVDLNPAARELSGQSMEAVMGKPMAEAFPEIPELGERAAGILEGEVEAVQGEGKARHYYSLRISPLHDQHDRLMGRLLILSDVTARKRVEEALQRRDAILDAVSYAAKQFLTTRSWEQNIQGVLARLGEATGASRIYIFQYYSKSGEVSSACQPYEWVAEGIRPQTDQPEQQPEACCVDRFERWQQILRRRELIQGHRRDFQADEREFLISRDIQAIIVTPIFVRDVWWGVIRFDQCTGEWEWSWPETEALRAAADTLGAAIEREWVEGALRKSEERYRQSVESSPNPIFSVSEDGSITSWNQACQKVFQFGQEIIGLHYQMLLWNPADQQAMASMVAHVFQNQSLNDVDIAFKCKDGAARFTVSRLYPLLDDRGKVQRCVFANTDVTERTSAAEALHRQLEELYVLHAVATAGAAATNEDTLIERATQIIGETFYLDNFGLLLFDETTRVLSPHPSYRMEEKEQLKPVVIGQGITGQAALDGRPRRISDVSRETNYFQVDKRTRSELCAPLKVGERVIGVINAESVELDAFTEADERLLVTLAGQLATAIDRIRAETAESRHAGQLSILYRASQEIASSLETDQVYAAIHQAAVQLLPSEVFVITLLDEGRQEIDPVYCIDRGHFIQAERIPVQRGLSGYVITSGEALRIDDSNQLGDIDLVHAGDPEKALSVLAAPLRLGEKVFGMLSCQSYQSRMYTDEDLRTLSTLANQAAIAIANARLFEETRRRAQQLAIINGLAGEMTGLLDIQNLYITVCKRLCLTLGYYNVSIFTVDWAARQVVLQAVGRPVRRFKPGKYRQAFGQGIIGRVAETGLARLVKDTRQDPDFFDIDGKIILSELAIPLKAGGGVIGVLNIDSDRPNAFDSSDVAMMTTIAGQFAVSLEKARLFEETRRRAGQQEALNTIIAAAAAATELKDLLETALQQILQALNLERGWIWADEQYFFIGLPYEASQVLARTALSLGKPGAKSLAVENWEETSTDDRLAGFSSLAARFEIRASLTVPILADGQQIGGLTLVTKTPFLWSADEIALLEAVGQQVGVVIERIELLEKIKDHASQIQQIMDTVPEGVLLLDEERRIVLANPAAEENLACLVDEQDGEFLTHLADVPIEELLEPAAQGLWRELVTRDAPRKIFELAARLLEVGDHPEGWVLVLRELTQERESQARIQMQERLATVGQLAAGIAHDFNNILAAILVYADLLRRDAHISSESRERLTVIQQQVHRAASLIRQILDFSRRSVMEQSVLDLLPFIKELEKLLRRVMPETIRLELTYQPGNYLVKADPAHLQQVFMNLAVNARDAMPAGGMLHFCLERLRSQPEERLPNPEIPPGDWIRITVKDSGAGIPPETMPHIFEPFFTTKPIGQGTGLGLAQAYGIIKQHDGHIEVYSQVGEGAAFHIYLPVVNLPVLEHRETGSLSEMCGGGELILLAEDDPSAREAFKKLLEANNYNVLAADNGRKALQLYEQRREEIALVVSDVVMPEMGGVALYHSLCERWQQVKMLFITGHPLREEDQALLEKGKVHWLQKPFTARDFCRVLKGLLSGEA